MTCSACNNLYVKRCEIHRDVGSEGGTIIFGLQSLLEQKQ
jgi:hypothetical protein